MDDLGHGKRFRYDEHGKVSIRRRYDDRRRDLWWSEWFGVAMPASLAIQMAHNGLE